MKHVLVILEGIADVPRRELDGRTPLQVARCPAARRLTMEGRCGTLGKVATASDGRPEFLFAALCGASLSDAARLHRGAVEAAGLEGGVGAYRWACRGNFVTMDAGLMRESRVQRMSLDETKLLCAAMQAGYDPESLSFTALAPALVTVRGNPDGEARHVAGNPAWAQDDTEPLLPSGRKGAWMREVLSQSAEILSRQTLNDVRIDLGENPATHLWLWGGGEVVKPHSFFGGVSRRGAVLTQSPLARGMGHLMGIEVVDMESPWSGEDAKPAFDEARVREIVEKRDVLVVAVEAPREGASFGSAVDKVRLIERLDLKVIAPLLRAVKGIDPLRLLLVADNTASPDYESTGGREPMVLWSSGARAGDGVDHFDETACAGGTLGVVAPEKAYAVWAGE